MPAPHHRRLGDDGPTPDPGTVAVVCQNLVVRYGSLVAVDGISFQAHRGEIVALLGPNGAGKTSTVETLEGYRRPTAGQVRVLGLDPSSQHHEVVSRIGVMLQQGGIYPMMTARRALELFAAYYPEPEEPARLLELVDLRRVANTPWRHLSGGEHQRLSLALAVIGRPEVVFLDEPTAGVDPEGRLGVRQIIDDIRRRGVCVVLTTHELSEAERLADHVIIISQGRVVAAGSPAELAHHGDTQVASLRFSASGELDTEALANALGAPVEAAGAGDYIVQAASSPKLTADLTAWLAAHEIILRALRTDRSLEEVYLDIVSQHPGTGVERDERPTRDKRRSRRRRSSRSRGRT